MNSKKNNRRSLFYSVVSLLLCVSMLMGTTLAWFSDSVSSTGNIIKTGRLKVEMHYADSLTGEWKDASEATIFNGNLWEPGYSDMKFIKVSNTGNLAFSYQMHILPAVQAVAGQANLADVIDVYLGVVDDTFVEPTAFSTDMAGLTNVGTLSEVMAKEPMTGVLLPADGGKGTLPESVSADTGDVTYCVILHMQETAGNEYQDLDVGNNFTIQLVATQYGYEQDNFGGSYDANSTYPDLKFPEMMDMDMGTAEITVDGENKLTAPVTLQGTAISATVPAGVLVEAGVTELTLIVEVMDETTSNIKLGEGEEMRSLDVHVAGVSAENTVPMIISLGAVAPEYLNQGNLTLAHVEDGQTILMTRVMDLADLDTHNEYYYDVETGALTVAMATFSEVAVAVEEPKWEGGVDHSWYVGKSSPYTIANADQLWSFSQIVGGMAEDENGVAIEADNFSGKYVKLLADIDLNDAEGSENTWVFYPIGYYNSENNYSRPSGEAITSGLRNFEGTFDGNGHTVANFYHNTWEMKGDHDWYNTATEQYYRDGMGLFGRVYGGTIENLTVKNFSSDGEIATTGVIAAYADFGATFENIAIFNCNPRVYNIGNGGIVGCVGWYTKGETEKPVTFRNITVDNSNKISALWGSYDVACGGLVGQYYPTSGQSSANYPVNAGIHMENCHVAAQMDVYNDVCANYQYYAYRYAGILIGSVRENEEKDGHSYPKMDGITASGCTVHFGDWNDYYYCELVANSLASYTHDHQMSRLEQVDSVDVEHKKVTTLKGETKDIPASGRVNYVVVKGFADGKWIHGDGHDYAECYHFVNGVQHFHDVADADNPNPTETVNGVEGVLKEDKQLVYREFNNLVTGYGWGVTSKGVDDLAGVEILDRAEANSVKKFEGKADVDLSGIAIGGTVSIADLFTEIENSGVAIRNENVVVAVTDLTYTGITAEFTRGTTWNEGMLKFNGTNGIVRITIQDYYFCTPTSIEVTVGEFNYVERFAYVFPNVDKYLYRVGNKNAFSVSNIFELEKGVDKTELGNVDIVVKDSNDEVLDAYTAGTGEWNSGTIDFADNFTGPVTVTISDNKYSKPITLNLEVVNATNVTQYGELKNQNSVLLDNITMSSNSAYYLSGGATLYGNGFTFDCKNGAYKGSGSVSENYVIALMNGHLDNVKIVGKVYTEYGAQAANDYNRALVVTKGNCSITNCYLSNTASPIRLVEGSLDVMETTVKGGNFANIDVRNGHLVLEDVTTINQAKGNDKADDGSDVIGLGVVVYYENVDANLTSLTIKGNLTQYNFISSEDTFTDSYAQQLVGAMMGDDYKELQLKVGEVEWVNSGVISMSQGVKPDVKAHENNAGYILKEDILFVGQNGHVYTLKPSESDVAANAPGYATIGQGFIAPKYSFDYTNKNYVAKTEGSNDYCYYENGKVLISMDQGDTFNWDPFILTVEKNSKILDYIVTDGKKTYSVGEKIPFNTAGECTVTYEYTDDNNYEVDSNGDIVKTAKTYTKTVTINVAVVQATTKHASFTFADTNTDTEYVTINNKTYISAKGVSAKDKEWGYITVNGTKIFYPITEAEFKKAALKSEYTVYYYAFKDAVTITDYQNNGTGDPVTYNAGTKSKPTGMSVVNGMEAKYTSISSACVDIGKLTKDGPSGEVWDFSASSTVSDPTTYNNYLAYQSPSGLAIKSGTRDYDAITVAQFSYQDNAGATYYYFVGYYMPNHYSSSSGGSPCVTPDTLVTMADGTQKRIDEVTYNDQILVWNFYTGEYDVAPASIIINHGAGTYTVATLKFSDGTSINTINGHGFYHEESDKFVILNEKNAADYVGDRFLKQTADGFVSVTLTDYAVEEMETESWGILTAEHYNCMLNDMFTLTDAEVPGTPGYLMPFEVGEGMKYDEVKMQADIEKYGLYTYEDFADLCTYEQFVGFGLDKFKVSVAKGFITWEDIEFLLDLHG